jgi:hypothetical protein
LDSDTVGGDSLLDENQGTWETFTPEYVTGDPVLRVRGNNKKKKKKKKKIDAIYVCAFL